MSVHVFRSPRVGGIYRSILELSVVELNELREVLKKMDEGDEGIGVREPLKPIQPQDAASRSLKQ